MAGLSTASFDGHLPGGSACCPMQALAVVLTDALMRYTSPVVEGGVNSLFDLAQHSARYPGTGMPPADLAAVQPRLIYNILLIREPQQLQYFWDTAMVTCVDTLAALTLVHLMPYTELRLEDPLPNVRPYFGMLGESTLPFVLELTPHGMSM